MLLVAGRLLSLAVRRPQLYSRLGWDWAVEVEGALAARLVSLAFVCRKGDGSGMGRSQGRETDQISMWEGHVPGGVSGRLIRQRGEGDEKSLWRLQTSVLWPLGRVPLR